MFLQVTYEKVPKFCKVCGLLGHKHDECGKGVYELKYFQYGDWMLADTPWNRAKLQSSAAPPKPRQQPPPKTQNQGNGTGRDAQAGEQIKTWEIKGVFGRSGVLRFSISPHTS